jgi:hypothetical protein
MLHGLGSRGILRAARSNLTCMCMHMMLVACAPPSNCLTPYGLGSWKWPAGTGTEGSTVAAVGTPIGMADYLIVGICLARSASLLTQTRAHFARVEGLVLAEPGIPG